MDDEPVRVPIDGVLDLHSFHPRDVQDLVSEYLRACREEGVLEVRIIHGKGKGVQRRMVQAVLERMEEVLEYRTADGGRGGWGATLVRLHARDA